MVEVGDILTVETTSGFFILAEITRSEYGTGKVFLNPCFTPVWQAKSADQLVKIITGMSTQLLGAATAPSFRGETFSLECSFDEEGDYVNEITYYRLANGVLSPWTDEEEEDEDVD